MYPDIGAPRILESPPDRCKCQRRAERRGAHLRRHAWTSSLPPKKTKQNETNTGPRSWTQKFAPGTQKLDPEIRPRRGGGLSSGPAVVWGRGPRNRSPTKIWDPETGPRNRRHARRLLKVYGSLAGPSAGPFTGPSPVPLLPLAAPSPNPPKPCRGLWPGLRIHLPRPRSTAGSGLARPTGRPNATQPARPAAAQPHLRRLGSQGGNVALSV